MSTAGGSTESCPTKAKGTTPQSSQSDFDSRIDAIPLSLRDFDIPGLGEPGPDCGSNRMPDTNAICPNGDAVRYEPMRCRRVGCPDCYSSEQRQRVFDVAVELEALARDRDERPHAVVFSPPVETARTYSMDGINTSLFRRGYRRAKRRCEIEGGYAVFHPARIRKPIQRRLRDEGYGGGGDEGGLWRGVRSDALELGGWREYCRYSPHAHTIGFPGYIEPHEGDDFVIRKYDTLDAVENVVNHTRYLLSHRGVFSGDGVIQSVRPWGLLHHAASGWDGAECELSDEEYASVCRDVANALGGEWSETDGLHYPDEETDECPECGTAVSEFIDLWDLPNRARESEQGGMAWLNSLTSSQRDFVREIIDILYNVQSPRIYQGDVVHPDDVAIMIDEDRPPPDVVE